MVLGIYGAGGFGRELLDLARTINNKNMCWEGIFFVVDKEYMSQESVNDAKVFEYTEAKQKYGKDLEVVVGNGEPSVRRRMLKQLKEDRIEIPSLIHPDVNIPSSTLVGRGTIIQFGCFISCNVKIESNVVIQPHCNIGHDSVLMESCIISGFGNIGGHVTIGKESFLGLSCAVREKITIGCNSVIGMGAVVLNDISSHTIAMGNPARIISYNDEQHKIFK